MVAAQRQNFGGDLAVTFEGLPPGMSAEPIPLTGGLSEIPVLFTAAADSQPAGALVGIVGKTVDEKLGIVGRLDQRTMLVRGQNNTDVWGHNADRMATVLCEEIPYSIEIVPASSVLNESRPRFMILISPVILSPLPRTMTSVFCAAAGAATSSTSATPIRVRPTQFIT